MSQPYDPRPYPGAWADNRKAIRRSWTIPFHWFEYVSRLLAYYLSHWSFLEVLEYAGRFTVLVAVIIYFSEAPSRRKQKHYQAWQVINSASGKSGNGGRLDALQELNEDHISLVAVDVSKAFLQGLQLPRADLHFAAMSSCDLRNSDLHGANLSGADLVSANLRNADLHGIQADQVDLRDADLTQADAGGAELRQADLRNADLRDMNWLGITDITLANIHGVENPPAGFVEWATAHGAVSIESDDAWNARVNATQTTTRP